MVIPNGAGVFAAVDLKADEGIKAHELAASSKGVERIPSTASAIVVTRIRPDKSRAEHSSLIYFPVIVDSAGSVRV